MTRSAWISLAVLGAWPFAAAAQPAAKAPSLTAQEQLGRQLFTQSCSVCHTKPVLTAGLYGPPLSRDSAGGDPAIMQQVITDGTPRMPAFKYQFAADQIAAIVAYLKTLPPPVASSRGSTKSDMD